MTTPKTIFITGASSGFGKAVADYMSQRGCRVLGTFRRTRIADCGFEVLPMDVTDDASVDTCVASAFEKTGGALDVVINCAGYGVCGAVEDTSPEEARAQFDTNVFGVLRVCRAVLPAMRRRGRGLIINFSSLGGMVSAPFHGFYCASKFAIEGMTDALRMEAARFGISVVLVEPGDFRTNFTANRVMAREAAGENSAYKQICEKSLKVMEASETSGPGPDRVVRVVEKIINARNPKARYIVAPGIQAIVPPLKKILPDKIFDRIIMGHYGI